jgi:hypothetical protein
MYGQTSVVTLLIHCCYAIVTLLLHCCYTVVTLLLHCCYTVVTLLLHCCYTVVISDEGWMVRSPSAHLSVPKQTKANRQQIYTQAADSRQQVGRR